MCATRRIPIRPAQHADVIGVLTEMERDGTLDHEWPNRVIEVINKADLMGGTEMVPVRQGAVAVSAITGEGLGVLTPRSIARSPRGWKPPITISNRRMGRVWPGFTSMAR